VQPLQALLLVCRGGGKKNAAVSRAESDTKTMPKFLRAMTDTLHLH
jgi:hypothetical protein